MTPSLCNISEHTLEMNQNKGWIAKQVMSKQMNNTIKNNQIRTIKFKNAFIQII